MCYNLVIDRLSMLICLKGNLFVFFSAAVIEIGFMSDVRISR